MIFVDVLAGETRSPAYMAINRRGQVPYIVDAKGFGVAESNAMLWYIADGSHLVPDNARDRAIMLQWMFFEQTRLEPNISPPRFYSFVLPHRAAEFQTEIPAWHGLELAGFPSVRRWIDRVTATPKFVPIERLLTPPGPALAAAA